MEEDHLEEQEEDNLFQEPAQQTLFSYYHQNLDQLQQDFDFNGNSGPETIMQVGFSLASPELKVKRRSDGGGARVIRSAAGRKDRHSKVCTARGTRDRRLRLSPKTAIQFYDVQDRLGYDRPSKAIDWLMKEAKAAIDALLRNNPSSLLASEAKTEHGKFQEMQHETPLFFKSDENPISGFDFLTNEAASYSNGDFNSSSVADLEMGRLQRIFNWSNLNAGEDCSAPPLHFPAPPEIFSQREPLQSTNNNYSPINWPFPGIGFSDKEMQNFTTRKEEEEEEDLDKLFFLHGSG